MKRLLLLDCGRTQHEIRKGFRYSRGKKLDFENLTYGKMYQRRYKKFQEQLPEGTYVKLKNIDDDVILNGIIGYNLDKKTVNVKTGSCRRQFVVENGGTLEGIILGKHFNRIIPVIVRN